MSVGRWFQREANLSILLRLLLITVIAAVMAVAGCVLIAVQSGTCPEAETLRLVVPRSVILWMCLSLILRHSPFPMAIYFGALSPFREAMLVHPLAVLAVFPDLGANILIGVETGALIGLVAKNWSPVEFE